MLGVRVAFLLLLVRLVRLRVLRVLLGVLLLLVLLLLLLVLGGRRVLVVDGRLGCAGHIGRLGILLHGYW